MIRVHDPFDWIFYGGYPNPSTTYAQARRTTCVNLTEEQGDAVTKNSCNMRATSDAPSGIGIHRGAFTYVSQIHDNQRT